MTTDHNEAMRLAEWLRQNSSGVYRPAAEAADLLTRQSAERDTLRAEVKRLKRERAQAIDKAGHMLAAGRYLSNCAFNLKQRVGETLSTHDIAALDSAQRAWDAAIDTARKATP